MDEIFNKWNDVKKIVNKKENKVVLKKEKYFGLGLDKIQEMKSLAKEMSFKDQFL